MKRKRGRKVRRVKKRSFKRYTKKRVQTRRKRSFRKPGVNASLKQVRFKIRVNYGVTEINDSARIIMGVQPNDLTNVQLIKNLPIMGLYNQWRVDKVQCHWRSLDVEKVGFQWKYNKKAISYHVMNDTAAAAFWGTTITRSDQSTTTDGIVASLLSDPTQLSGCKVKHHSPFGGSVTFKPYVTETVSTLSKPVPENAPTAITDIRHNYKGQFRYKSSLVAYECPVFIAIPPIDLKITKITGGIGSDTVDVSSSISDFPQIERYSDIYVTCRNYGSLYTGGTPARVFNPMDHATERMVRAPEPIVNPNIPDYFDYNQIHGQFNKIKEEVQNQVVNEISNTHPVFTAAATMLGLGAKRMRHDEIK